MSGTDFLSRWAFVSSPARRCAFPFPRRSGSLHLRAVPNPVDVIPDEFPYAVFLSHSAKDKVVVRPLAERLRADGVKVWFNEWVLQTGDSIPAKIEAGLERSRVLVLCMSANAFGSDWAQLESGTFSSLLTNSPNLSIPLL